MLTRREYVEAQRKAADMILESGIRITDRERSKIGVADFGLSNLQGEGAQILTLVDTKRVALKIIVLFSNQTEPEHWHPRVGDDPGKEETLLVIKGTVFLYVPGREEIKFGFIPKGKDAYYTVRHEIVMHPGDQITLEPGTIHWFQAGKEGAVIYMVSSTARDILDRFTDPNVARETRITD